MTGHLAPQSKAFKADVIIELPQYVSEAGTLNCFYRARVTRGFILEKWHSKGDGEPYLAGVYRVVASDSKYKNRLDVFWSLKGHPKMKVAPGPIRDEVVAVARHIVKCSRALSKCTAGEAARRARRRR